MKKILAASPKSKSWLHKMMAYFSHEPKNKAELMDVLHDAEDRHIVNNEMMSMIERILHVSDMQVREIMVPKAAMIMVEINQPLEAILPLVIESAHSRFPVFDPVSQDIVGILLAKDLLNYTLKPTEFNIRSSLRPAIFIPQNKRLDILLREFRVNRNHLAIVMDEYGHTSGLVTIEDVLEQIVGDIEDEYDIDEEEAVIKKIDDEAYIIKASTHLTKFNAYFNTALEAQKSQTIGQVVRNRFGHVPKRNKVIEIDNFRFKILHSDNRRIYLLEVKLISPDEKETL